jgi:formate hydrogenlyase subunit 4
MSAWVSALVWLVAGPVLVLAMGPFLDGFGRRVRARLEARRGPPLLQGYSDLAKLAGKESISAAVNPVTAIAPWVALTSAVTAALLVPLGGATLLGFGGDMLVLLYLLGLSSAAIVLGATGSGSAYAFLGASRELMLLLLVEPVVACGFLVIGLQAGTFRLDALAAWQLEHGPTVASALAAAAVIVALLAYLGRVPFDLSEAEQELTGGALVEFGGRPLALFRWALFTRWLVAAWVVVEVFLPTPLRGAAGAAVTALEVLVLFGALSALSTLFARLRIDGARVFLVQIGLLVLFAIAFAVIGA